MKKVIILSIISVIKQLCTNEDDNPVLFFGSF